MTKRRRLGVALLFGPPEEDEVQGLRRALGDPGLPYVPPHLTLVPPVNVREENVAEAAEIVRLAAGDQAGPIEVHLGPAATFGPDSPVVYLCVGTGGGAQDRQLEQLERLRASVLSGPLSRSSRWPWVPHVTVCDDAAAAVLAAAPVALSSYGRDVCLERLVHLEQTGRAWAPLSDAFLGHPAVAGRGGLQLELTTGSHPGPAGLALLASAGALWPGPERRAIVVTGRRFDGLAGLAAAWWEPRPGLPVQVGVTVAEHARDQGVGSALLRALEQAAVSRGWALQNAHAHGPLDFFAHCSPGTGYARSPDEVGRDER